MKKPAAAILPLLILAAAIVFTVWLLNSKPEPKRAIPKSKSVLVNVVTARPISKQIQVVALGTVQPFKQIEISPQVSGTIIEQSPELVSGGLFKKGDTIARIDPRDYLFVLEQKKAEVEKVLFELKVEQGRQTIAEREWELLEQDIPDSGANKDLALRKPHLEQLKALLNSAKSSLEKAELDIQRTEIKAPFNALVTDEYVDIGQLVTPQTKLATLVGTDQYQVQVSIPVNQLKWINIPRENNGDGSRARVTHELGQGERIVRDGRVVKLLGDLDPAGRQARLLVAVEDPMGSESSGDPGNFPLFIGAYVEVEIEGNSIDNVFEVPRTALHENNMVWIVDGDDKLAIRRVETIWRSNEDVLVGNGLKDGDRIVTSRIASPVPGLELVIEKTEKK
jgi:RND family efflux transporter MFP subunit